MGMDGEDELDDRRAYTQLAKLVTAQTDLLHSIDRRLDSIMATLADLDAAIASEAADLTSLASVGPAITTLATSLATDTAAIIAALKAAGNTDFTTEVNNVNANIASLNAIGTAVTSATSSIGASDSSIQAADAPPVPPAAPTA
jgi:hypothetical protein